MVQYLNLNCNICENRKNFKIDVEDLSLLKYKLLKIRTKIKCFNTVKNVCKYHKTQFVIVFSNYYGRCAHPLRSHKNFVKTSLHEISLEEFRLYCVPYDILPWQKLCFCFKNKVFVEKKENKNADSEHENENEVMETHEISHEITNIDNIHIIRRVKTHTYYLLMYLVFPTWRYINHQDKWKLYQFSGNVLWWY